MTNTPSKTPRSSISNKSRTGSILAKRPETFHTRPPTQDLTFKSTPGCDADAGGLQRIGHLRMVGKPQTFQAKPAIYPDKTSFKLRLRRDWSR